MKRFKNVYSVFTNSIKTAYSFIHVFTDENFESSVLKILYSFHIFAENFTRALLFFICVIVIICIFSLLSGRKKRGEEEGKMK